MKLSNMVSILKQMFKSLSADEQQSFLDSLKNEPKDIKGFESLKHAVIKRNPNPLPDRCNCPHCQGTDIVKNGNRRGVQRFMCKECKRTFTYSTNTIVYKSSKSIEVWKKFCECFLNKFPLRKCAELCNINLHTAFNWRHKILDALQNMQSSITLRGIVETDGTYYALSFKGSHEMPRETHMRGHSVSTRGLSKEMVCVPCMVNHSGFSLAKISSLGKPSLNDLGKVIDNRIEKGSVFVTDSFRGYQKVAKDNDLTHIRILKGKRTNGSFNIQTVNSYHSQLRKMVDHHFRGVATKYLNNYIVYNNFVNIAKNTFENKLNKLEDFVFSTKCLTRCLLIKLRPAVPV